MAEVSSAGDNDAQHLLENRQLASLFVMMSEILRNTVLFEMGLKYEKLQYKLQKF